MNIYIYIITMSLVTYLIRMLPLILVKNEITNKTIRSFLYYVPYTVLAAMTFPVIFYSTNYIITAIIGTIVALYLSYKDKDLITVALISSTIVLVLELII